MPPSVPNSLQQTALEPRWITREVVLIFVAQVVFGFGWSLYLLMPKFLATSLHAGPEVIGVITACGGLAGLLTVPFTAVGLDRLGRKLFYRVAALLVVLLSFGYLRVHEVSLLVYALQGCVAAAFVLAFNATAALLADWAPPARLGQAIGWLGGANVGMNAVATMIAEPLAMRHGWHAVFELGVAAGGAAFLLSFFLREAPDRARVSSAPQPARGAWMYPGLGTILLATMLVGGVFAALFSFMQPYAISLGAREVSKFFLGFTIAAVVCRLLLGGLGDRLGRRAVSVSTIVGYGLCALIMIRLDPHRLLLYGLAFGTAHGLLYPTMNALVLEVVPIARRGFGMALYNGAFNAGVAASSLGWGLLAKQYGYPSVYATATLAALLAAAVLARGRHAATITASAPLPGHDAG